MAFCCADIDTLVHTYLDGELAVHDREELEQHIAQCAGCRGRVDDELQFRADLRCRLVPPKASDLLRARVSALLDAEDRAAVTAQRRRGMSWILPGTASVAAAAALVLVAVTSTESGVSVPDNDNRPAPVADSRPPAADPRQRMDVPILKAPGVTAKRASFGQFSGRQSAQFEYEVERNHERHEMMLFIFPGNQGTPPQPDGRAAITIKRADGEIWMFTGSMPQDVLIKVLEDSDDGWLRGSYD